MQGHSPGQRGTGLPRPAMPATKGKVIWLYNFIVVSMFNYY